MIIFRCQHDAVVSNWKKCCCGTTKMKLNIDMKYVDVCHRTDTFSQNSSRTLLGNEDCIDY